ncbi:hypothetical protein [Thermanaerothrix sp.]|uniref:hypothetical protein n=1 Tax=Thermanaerothrix sp. TaxID=2972675 RepID=UPI002ADD89AC|nr:hypothetical protein [Thermanaerothrix sp.]
MKNTRVLALTIFALNLLLVSSSLTPPFWQINPHDEAKYIESGWRLLIFEIRDMAWGPLVALVYAPLHLVFKGSLDWFILEAWGGRIILYSLMWWSTYYLGLRFKDIILPYALLGVLFVSMPFIRAVVNQSDALFVCCSAIALGKILDYHRSKRLKDVGISSLFVGLAILCRAEAVLLLPIFIIALGLLTWKKVQPSYLPRVGLYALLPIFLILGIYVSLYWLSTNSLDLGFGYKSYDSFEWNQSVLTGGDLDLARQEARRLFGTPEENNYSVVRAILRNPPAFAQRIWANLKTLPEKFFELFDKRLGLLTLILAVAGAITFLRNYPFSVLAVVLLWGLQPFVALGFLALHIVPQISYLILILTAAGVTSLVAGLAIERKIIIASLIGIGMVGLLGPRPVLLSVSLVSGGALILGWLMAVQHIGIQKAISWSFFIAALILRPPYQDLFLYPPIGTTSEEQAVHYIQQNFPPHSTIAVATPRLAIAARVNDVGLESFSHEVVSSAETLRVYLIKEKISAVVYTPAATPFPIIFGTIEQNLDSRFKRVFYSDDLSVQIYVPISQPE